MQSTSWETLGWRKHKLESRLLGEISITSDMQRHHPYGRKWRRTKEPLLMKMKEESEKVGLKLSIQIAKIMASSPIHNWVSFLLWLHPFFLSGVISPLISSSILGTYRPGEFIFQCPIFSLFLTVHGALKARTLKGFVIPFSSGPHRETCMQVRKQQLELDMEQQTGSK